MEMEGRGFSDLLRNTSEEIFLRTMMENPLGVTAPSLEMLGFKNITQSFRGESEELFNSWLANGENSGCSSSVAGHRARQASRRISTDFVPGQQNGVSFQKSGAANTSPHNLSASGEHTNDPGQRSLRNAAEKGMQASNLCLAKAWFSNDQPMTRSRSSELRRRYAAMQSSQVATIPQAANNFPDHSNNKMKQEFANANNFCDAPVGDISNRMHLFMFPSNSSTTFNAPPVVTGDTVSSVVSMLKGTLERKKLNCKVEKEMMEGSFYGMLSEAVPNRSSTQAPGSQVNGQEASFHMASPVQVTGPSNLASVGKFLELSIEGFTTQTNQQPASQEHSQSESSTSAPALSTGFEGCDGPAYSGQTMFNVSSSRHFGNGTSEHEIKANECKESLFDSSYNYARKNANLVPMGSITLAASVDRADPTKKRRVERFRKMAEAKERNCIPPLPSDMQAVLKRCETLEKEVRSLKLNLSFMNRKDSEQTKQIEELQKQNDGLVIEKERLLEEIERIIPDTDRM